jgi:membrane protein DedA with SNARE-associated domain
MSRPRLTHRFGAADRLMTKYGKLSVFVGTFVPYSYAVKSFAAGLARMNWVAFFLPSVAGFGLKYAFLEGVGYYSFCIFTASFDYSQRTFFSLLLALASIYTAVYLVRDLRTWERRHEFTRVDH